MRCFQTPDTYVQKYGINKKVGTVGDIIIEKLLETQAKGSPIRPKARGLAQNGGLPGWLEDSDPAGVILYVMDGPYCLPFLNRTSCPDRSCSAGI